MFQSAEIYDVISNSSKYELLPLINTTFITNDDLIQLNNEFQQFLVAQGGINVEYQRFQYFKEFVKIKFPKNGQYYSAITHDYIDFNFDNGLAYNHEENQFCFISELYRAKAFESFNGRDNSVYYFDPFDTSNSEGTEVIISSELYTVLGVCKVAFEVQSSREYYKIVDCEDPSKVGKYLELREGSDFYQLNYLPRIFDSLPEQLYPFLNE